MRTLFIIFFTTIFSCFTNKVKSQEVKGEWYGNGKVNVGGEHSSYLSELVINQAGSFIMGEFNFYFKDKYYTHKITGIFNKKTRELVLKPIHIIYYKSKTENSVDCLMEGKFKLLINNLGSYLEGSFKGVDQYAYGCPNINFKFIKTIHPTHIDLVEEENNEENKDVSKNLITNVTLLDAEKKLLQRAEVILNEIIVDSSKIKIELYDNGEYDNDTISVFYNQKLLTYKKELSDKPIYLNIEVNTEPNSLSMFAENLGKYPPNTALLIIWDGDKRHEIMISSNLKQTGKIIIRKRN